MNGILSMAESRWAPLSIDMDSSWIKSGAKLRVTSITCLKRLERLQLCDLYPCSPEFRDSRPAESHNMDFLVRVYQSFQQTEKIGNASWGLEIVFQKKNSHLNSPYLYCITDSVYFTSDSGYSREKSKIGQMEYWTNGRLDYRKKPGIFLIFHFSSFPIVHSSFQLPIILVYSVYPRPFYVDSVVSKKTLDKPDDYL